MGLGSSPIALRIRPRAAPVVQDWGMSEHEQNPSYAPAPDAEKVGRARWTRLAMVGFAMALAGPVLMVVAGLLGGVDVEPFFLIVSAIALCGLVLSTIRSVVARVVAAVAALLVGMALFWTAFGLMSMAAFFDFVPGILVLPGVLVAIGATIASIRAMRRGDFTLATDGRERSVVVGILGMVLILTAASAVLTATSRTTARAADADELVVMDNFGFDPEDLEVAAGSTILVKNDDPFLHTFTVDELDIDVEVGPGSSKLVQLPSGADEGDYVLYCEPHTSDPDDPSDDDMAGTLVVE
jgi:plastocyanin